MGHRNGLTIGQSSPREDPKGKVLRQSYQNGLHAVSEQNRVKGSIDYAGSLWGASGPRMLTVRVLVTRQWP